MFPYVATFFFTALFALLQPVNKPWKSLGVWIPVALYFIVFIGLRHSVGSDWNNYYNMFYYDAANMTYMDALRHGDPLFYLLMVWVQNMGWTIHIVDLVSAVFFTAGLVIFVRRMPNPWLAMLIALSYTVLTLGMGYVRQGVALGFSLWAITALLDRKFIKFFILIILAAGFHKSAVLMLGFGLFQGGKGKYFKILASVIIGAGAYVAFMSGEENRLVQVYIESNMKSSGAYIRTFMNVLPAMLFLYYRKKWKRLWPEGYALWNLMAVGAIAAVPAVMLYSTATDRATLYLIPLQFVVFSHLPLLLRGKISPRMITVFVVIYYGAVYFVWLGLAKWSFAWVPYQNILTEWLGFGNVIDRW